MRTLNITSGIWSEIFFVSTTISFLSLSYSFVSFATNLTKEGEEKDHNRKEKIVLGLLITSCVTINLVVMAMLSAFLKLFCVPIFIFVGFLASGNWNFKSRKNIKETILDGLTCMFVPCLKRHSGSGEVQLGFAMTYYVIFNFGYGIVSRACLLQMIIPHGDPPVFYCHPTNMTCNGFNTFSAPPNMTFSSLLTPNSSDCSEYFFTFDTVNDTRRKYHTYCVDGYFDSYIDIYHFCFTTVTSVLCVYLSLRLAMLGKNSPKSPQSSIRMISIQGE